MMMMLFGAKTYAQTAEMKGQVTDYNSKEPLIGANISLWKDGKLSKGTSSDGNGKYSINGFSAGQYEIRVSYLGYATHREIRFLSSGNINYINIALRDSVMEGTIITVKPKEELVKPGENMVVKNSDYLIAFQIRNPVDFVAQRGGAISVDLNNVSIKGARPSATGYYLGAIPLMGRMAISPRALSQSGLILGGVAAEFGDFIGGAIVQNLASPAGQRRVNLEMVSSSLFDQYHYNQLDFNISGPLLVKKADSDHERMVLGYHFNLNYIRQADANPSAVGIWKVKDEVMKQIEASPLTKAGNGYVPRAEFLRLTDLEQVSARQNAEREDLNLMHKMEYQPNNHLQLQVAGVYHYGRGKVAPFSSSLFNTAQHPISTSHNLVLMAQLEHNLYTKLDTQQLNRLKISRLRYSVTAQYQSIWSRLEDPTHGDRYFDYGYLGQFRGHRAKVYEQRNPQEARRFTDGRDTLWVSNFMEHTGYSDTLYTFDSRGTKNPLRARYTEQYYELVGRVNQASEIRGSNAGLLNGMAPIGIYSNMWDNVANPLIGSSVNNGVGKNQNEQFSFNVFGELGIGKHSIKGGFYYEQRSARSYSVNALNLWDVMYQKANEGIELDLSNPIFHRNANGLFNDTISYHEVYKGAQTGFAYQLRQELMRRGTLDLDGNPYHLNRSIDIHSLHPDVFSLALFTPDELLGTGGNTQMVKYFGYDHLGRKQRGRFSIDDFLSRESTRSIGAYQPVYMAAFIQDQLEIKNFITRFGLRVERFDANQPVLRDPYSLYPIKQAGEIREINGNLVEHPTAVPKTAAVYVDDLKNPQQIVGYRAGNQWYNREGIQLLDPAVLASQTKSGVVQPWLVSADESFSSMAFQAYDAQTLILPRISFDFPISTEARFFAYYDMLSQRPSNIFTPIDDYYFLRFNSSRVINNPALKPQLTTDYELGFKQAIADNSALSLIAGYREQRNLIQLQRFNYAYPVSYLSFGNIDFATIQSFRVEYEYRGDYVMVDAGYTYQTAFGTGSGPASQGALVAAGQPNLRQLFPTDLDIRHAIKFNFVARFGEAKTYKGPVLKDKQLFSNGGISLSLAALSGMPYTSQQLPISTTQRGVVQRSPIVGTPNGSRTPWQLQNNLNLFRSFPIVIGKNEKGEPKMGSLTTTLWVQNFLNVKNIIRVHAYSGNASEDGYLNSPTGRQAASEAISAASFIDLYQVALNNPGFYAGPRQIRWSVLLNF